RAAPRAPRRSPRSRARAPRMSRRRPSRPAARRGRGRRARRRSRRDSTTWYRSLVIWLLLALALAFAVFLAAGTWLAYDPRSIVGVRRLPRTTIALAPGDAEVRIVGTVRSIHTRISPAGATCVVYHAITEERQRHGHHIPGLADTTWVRCE